MRLWIVMLLLGLAGSVLAGESRPDNSAWKSINSESAYRVEGKGDPAKEDAHVSIRATGNAPEAFGGAIASLDAAGFRGQRVILSSNLSAIPGTNGAAIWIRADGVAGRLQFDTSQGLPIIAGAAPAHREASIVVPDDATQLIFGVVMKGNGGVEATDLRLRAIRASDVMESALKIVRDNALKAGAIDWNVVPEHMRVATRGARTPADVYPAIRELLSMLGDGHSFHVNAEAARQHETTASARTEAVVKLLPEGVGYVSMPGFVGRDEQGAMQFEHLVNGEIQGIAAKATAGWIVDLRNDTGGNMWPMLAALKSLLGKDAVGGARGRNGQERKWRIESAEEGIDLTMARVAVLLGPRTSSSGEAVAVAFHGRPATRSFGQPTDGRSTVNGSYKLADGSLLFLTTAVDVDRNGVAFGGVMQPDELTPIAADERDPAIDAAAAWLRHNTTMGLSRPRGTHPTGN